MKPVDPKLQARVWERVRSGAQLPDAPREDGVAGLLAEQWAVAAACLQLARQSQAREAEALRTLFRRAQSQVSCLRGIHTMMTGRRPAVRTVQPEKETFESALRRCYTRELACLRAYEARAQDAAFGAAFSRLAEQTREDCRTILELIGGTKAP